MTRMRPRVKNKHKIDVSSTNYKKFVKSIENLSSITKKWCRILSANSKPLQNILSNAVQYQEAPRQKFKTKNLLLKYLSKSSSLQILLFFTVNSKITTKVCFLSKLLFVNLFHSFFLDNNGHL